MLRLDNVTKIFHPNTPNEKIALKDLNLHIQKGDFVTVIGSNGSGKSTLFNLIGGTFLADEGNIFLDGEDITFLPDFKRAGNIGRLFQDPLKGTAPSMTIEENLALCYMRSQKKIFKPGVTKKNKAYFRECLSHLELGLEDRMQTKMGLLSGGQRQAVTLLMGTLVAPKVLLLDEHTAALDPGTATKVLQITKQIVEDKNLTTLMITHNIKDALSLGNRLLMMDSGRVVLDISGNEKSQLEVEDILRLFHEKSQKNLSDDKLLLV